MSMKSLLVTGYRHTDLGIFSDKDIRVKIIKQAVRKDLCRLLDEGVEWFLFTGQLGFEWWCLEVLKDLRQEGYVFKLATIFAFEDHGQEWSEANQVKLSQFKQMEFVKYAYHHYQHPGQLRSYQKFLLDNSDGIYLFYDAEHETRLKYLYQEVVEKEGYYRKTLTFDRLNEVAENFSNSE